MLAYDSFFHLYTFCLNLLVIRSFLMEESEIRRATMKDRNETSSADDRLTGS